MYQNPVRACMHGMARHGDQQVRPNNLDPRRFRPALPLPHPLNPKRQPPGSKPPPTWMQATTHPDPSHHPPGYRPPTCFQATTHLDASHHHLHPCHHPPGSKPPPPGSKPPTWMQATTHMDPSQPPTWIQASQHQPACPALWQHTFAQSPPTPHGPITPPPPLTLT